MNEIASAIAGLRYLAASATLETALSRLRTAARPEAGKPATPRTSARARMPAVFSGATTPEAAKLAAGAATKVRADGRGLRAISDLYR